MEFAINKVLKNGVTATWCVIQRILTVNLGTLSAPQFYYEIRVDLYLNQAARNDPEGEALKAWREEGRMELITRKIRSLITSNHDLAVDKRSSTRNNGIYFLSVQQ